MRKTNCKIKISKGERAFDIINILLLLVFMVCVMLPLIHVLAASFSKASSFVMHEGILLYPLDFCIDAYKAVFKNVNILIGYKNTLFIVVVATSLNLLLTWIAAYVLSRKNLMFGKPILFLIIFSMYFSGGTIPTYMIVKGVGLYNSVLSLILPGAISTFNFIIMRTAMMGVPDELIEAAELDGANHIYILRKVMIPLVKPTTAVICLYYAVSHWNSWFNAMLYIRDRAKYPLQLILREILIMNDITDMAAGGGMDEFLISETIQFATIIVATLPILCIYPFLQKYFVKGVMVGAVKG